MIYHIFTNNTDEYTTDKKEAYTIYNSFVAEYDCARLYELEQEGDNGDCIESHGHWPQ